MIHLAHRQTVAPQTQNLKRQGGKNSMQKLSVQKNMIHLQAVKKVEETVKRDRRKGLKSIALLKKKT